MTQSFISSRIRGRVLLLLLYLVAREPYLNADVGALSYMKTGAPIFAIETPDMAGQSDEKCFRIIPLWWTGSARWEVFVG